MSGFRGPLRYTKPGAALDGAPLELVDALSLVALDVERERYFGFADDFARYMGPLAVATPNAGGFLLQGNATAAATQKADATGGVVRLITGAVDNDVAALLLQGSIFRYTVGKKQWFAVRVAGQTVADMEITLGFVIDGYAGVLTTLPTDGIFFEKAETAVRMDFHARKNAASTETTAVDGSDLVADTMREYAIAIDENGNIAAYVNGALVASVAAGNANIPDDENLTAFLGVQTGSATTRYLDVDSWLAAAER